MTTIPPILCLEVGHTRTKAAFLPKKITSIEDLKNVQTQTLLSEPWLKQNIQDLFKKNCGSPLDSMLDERSTGIALSIFGPLYDSRFHGCAQMYGVPQNIKEVLEAQTGREFRIEGDAVSWAIGAVEYLALKSHKVALPCLAITLGTHPGVAFVEEGNKVTSLEFWPWYYSFPKLGSCTEIRPSNHVLSKGYLDSIAEGEEKLDEYMKTYRATFNTHFYAFVEDLSDLIQEKFSKRITSVLVGGGHSRFIDPRETTIVLNPQTLSQEGISSDMVQLLGCHRQLQESPYQTNTYPPYEELCRLLSNE